MKVAVRLQEEILSESLENISNWNTFCSTTAKLILWFYEEILSESFESTAFKKKNTFRSKTMKAAV